MTSPDDQDPVRSELEYAPPWVREQAAREQSTREQPAREQTTREPIAHEPAPREHITRDQFRAALRQSGGPAGEQAAQNDPENRRFADDRPWHQRALEPELVPEPPAGVSNIWPMMLRLGAVCAVAAMVAAVVVFLFSPKQSTHKIAEASASAPVSIADDATPSSMESSRGVPASLPALAVETSAAANNAPPPPAQGQVALATPPQLTRGKVVTAPPAKPEAPPPQIASLPAPGVNEPTSPPVDANSAAIDPKPAANPAPPPSPAQTAPAQTAPAQTAPRSVAKPAVVLDENEIDTLIKRGKNLLNDGDFAAARVLFERAANAGSAEAALALGSTYDPNVIKRLGAIMVQPDVENARKWYQLAAARGLAAASVQLANLPQSR